jgi:hypothetical protein
MKRVLSGMVLVAAAALLARAANATGGTAAVVWKPLGPGAERGISSDGPFRLEMFRFDLERYDAEVVVGGRERPPRARIWMAGARHTAAEVLHRAGAGQVAAVVNGGFFDENGHSLGLRMIHGHAAVPLRGNVDWGVFAVADGRARIVHSRDFASGSGIQAAIQVGPRILIEGVVPKLKPQVARRTAVAIDRDGKTVTLVVADAPVDAAALGNRLASFGFHSALLLDGGPSTQIAVAIGAPATAAPVDQPVSAQALGSLEIPGSYPVPDLLAIVRH